jgi:hypothetical protein
MSYNGKVDFGLLADWDAVPDIDFVTSAIKESLDELLEAAGAAKPSGSRAKAKAKA